MTATILIVDDSLDVQRELQSLLSINGYQVSMAGDGRQAVAMLRDGRCAPDLILLDLQMPVMDGWEFLWWHANDAASHELPIVLLSADVHQRAEVPTSHVACIVPKPVDPRQLLDAIHAVLASH